MSLQTLVNRALDSPVDFSFIKRVVGKTVSIRMVDHETNLKHRPSLSDVFKGHQAAAILLHIAQGKSKIGHWVLLLQKKGKNPIIFFDELDKVSETPRGEEIVGVLTHLTDHSQNASFCDRYFDGKHGLLGNVSTDPVLQPSRNNNNNIWTNKYYYIINQE